MELCELVSAFRPKDVYPCTVDADTWDDNVSVESLFGHLCSGGRFAHDNHMRRGLDETRDERHVKRARYSMMRDVRDRLQRMGDPTNPFTIGPLPADLKATLGQLLLSSDDETREAYDHQRTTNSQGSLPSTVTGSVSVDETRAVIMNDSPAIPESQDSVPESLFESQNLTSEGDDIATTINPDQSLAHGPSSSSVPVSDSVENRRRAYRAARAGTFEAWSAVSLLSAGNNHTEEEIEL
jgi:DNA cross-link repair 1C protein